jgi:tetratricopeptide (TPR) repeat protein
MNNLQRIGLWVLFVCSTLLLSAYDSQAHIPDSVKVRVEKETSPEKRADKYLEFAHRVVRISADSAIAIDNQLIEKYEAEHFNYGIGRAKSFKAWHLCFLGKYEEALRMAHEALAVQKDIQDSTGIANTLNRLGIANVQFKRYKDGKGYFLQALSYYTKLADSSKIDAIFNNLGIVASEEKKPAESIAYYKKSLAIRTAKRDSFWMAYSYYNIGEAFLGINNIDSGSFYLLLAYKTFKETGSHKVPPMVMLGVGSLYTELKKYPEAIGYIEEGLSGAVKMNHVELIVDGKLQLSELLFKMGRYKDAYTVHQEYEKLRIELDSANNASRVAEVEGQYKTAENEAQLATLRNEKLEAENSAQQFKLYMLVVAVVSLVVIFGIVIMLLRKNQKEQIQRSVLNAKISEIRMMALRAQMNPHFIFNCINTAQHFIMSSEKEKAYQYLSDFARLLRMVLDNSNKVFIPVEDEITQLRLYIELEETRFINKFKYSFEIDPELKNGVYEIPGMILQPIIENAIGHGLMNRNDDQGRLFLTMKLMDDSILCEIIDNGVGREKARAIKSQKKINHQSAALPNINERLKMLQTQTNSIISIEIVDLFESGSPSGTMVKVLLPYQ